MIATTDAVQADNMALRRQLIPIAAHTVIMPLIGTIDSNRAGQVMETLALRTWHAAPGNPRVQAAPVDDGEKGVSA